MANAKNVTADKTRMLAYMKCKSVSIGVETGDMSMRKMLNRREHPKDIVRAVKLMKIQGIRVSSFNMIGLPFETEETIKATIELNRAAEIEHPNISLFMPLEGTKLYDISVKNGFYNPSKKAALRTDKPSLDLPGISMERLEYYYQNFHTLVTGDKKHDNSDS